MTTRRAVYLEDGSLPYRFKYIMTRFFYGQKCPVCNCTMQVDSEFGLRDRIPSIQHNKPISKGGKHTLDNISIICKKCNVTIKNKEIGNLNNNIVVEIWNNFLERENA
jgi:5-methylcytosine-specific restriction endonuclease McrA